jgi:uncharacterized phage protein (TIGR02216 family)
MADAAGRKGVGQPDKPPSPFPWREAIGFGLGVLRLPPEQFWRMTPRELAFAIEAVTGRGGAPLARSSLTELMMRYPDE